MPSHKPGEKRTSQEDSNVLKRTDEREDLFGIRPAEGPARGQPRPRTAPKGRRTAVPRPSEHPPWRTVYGYFARWRADATLNEVHDALRAQVRAAAERGQAPSAAVIDSQPVRATGTVARTSRRWGRRTSAPCRSPR
jgi:hypothetical protein